MISVVTWIAILNCVIFAGYMAFTGHAQRAEAFKRYEVRANQLEFLKERMARYESLKSELKELSQQTKDLAKGIFQLNRLSKSIDDFIPIDDEKISTILDRPMGMNPKQQAS